MDADAEVREVDAVIGDGSKTLHCHSTLGVSRGFPSKWVSLVPGR